MKFVKTHNDPNSAARCGVLTTDHGQIETPIFMPVGTVGTVKGVQRRELEDDIKAQIKNLQKLETLGKGELKRLKNRIKNIGSSDYEMRKAIIFRENYLNEMKKYENFDNYDKLMEKLHSIKNPLAFFDYVSQNEITQDLTYQSDQYYTQREFDKFIEDFGIDLNGDEFFGEIEEL